MSLNLTANLSIVNVIKIHWNSINYLIQDNYFALQEDKEENKVFMQVGPERRNHTVENILKCDQT